MKKIISLFSCFIYIQLSFAQSVLPPDKIYGPLFVDVQMSKIFPDNKTFVDCTPKRTPESIVKDYLAAKKKSEFNIKSFVEENFNLPQSPQNTYSTKETSAAAHINNLWNVLKRGNDSAIKGSSLLPLPYPYIVPGGRFREIYYWDSYFTMQGLKANGQVDMIQNMIKNFAYLINTYGHIPNGNRSYYLSRSQPPFFSLMVGLLADIKGEDIYKEYLPAMQKEYNYWMDKTAPTKHVVYMPDGSILNRYYDQLNIPRQEAYTRDVEAYNKAKNNRSQIYRNLRSAAESGWDFSSRWFTNDSDISTIQTINLIPVDLNTLLFTLEKNLAKGYRLSNNLTQATHYDAVAQKRKTAINKYCWSAKWGWYVDYNMVTKRHSPQLTLAGLAPFFQNIAVPNYIYITTHNVKTKFLKGGGLVTTLHHTGQQWDAPNAWAPLEWMAITGLDNYGQKELAKTIATRWMKLNERVFQQTGKLMEKYNVEDINLEAGGGEYPSQDGFGWTNGVLMGLTAKYGAQQTF